mmetsp:Transcript_76902/g.213686  ORF Transcript_76902/g.213686 Transcript_76902/m.213686 type:complete len:256 (+) Transcript_76902:83-850(+)
MAAPFWAGRRDREKDRHAAVLPAGYEHDPVMERSRPPRSSRPLFPAGASAQEGRDRGRAKNVNSLPLAVVRRDERMERAFGNRHVRDKRFGATARAEELRRQILRGSQEATVVRGAVAFRDREGPGYADCDRLQPEGNGGQPPLPPQSRADGLEDAGRRSSSSDSEASSDCGGVAAAIRRKRARSPVAATSAAQAARRAGLVSGTSTSLRRRLCDMEPSPTLGNDRREGSGRTTTSRCAAGFENAEDEGVVVDFF